MASETITKLNHYQHPAAIVESTSIGAGTRIWAFAHILPGAIIGRDCNICDHTFIENDVVIGDRVTVKCGVQVWDGIRLENDVFIGPNATFTNDPFPRSKQYLAAEELGKTFVKAGASIGANATILPGITIGERAMIGAGAVVTRNVPPDTIITGNPGRIVGYVGAKEREPEAAPIPNKAGVQTTKVLGVTVHKMPGVHDLRGYLSFGEAEKHVPFPIRRYFLVYGVPSQEIRGEHAHKKLDQFLICVRGSVNVVADDGKTRQEVVLDDPSIGIYIPPGVWCVQYKHSADAVLLVLASRAYEAADYIRNYSEFLEYIGQQAQS